MLLKRFPAILAFIALSGAALTACAQPGGVAEHQDYFLIAHRGGVVDSVKAENSLPALQAAFERGYKMAEVDMRLTKDAVLIIHHDDNFKRYFGVDRKVSEMTWKEISSLKSDKGGSAVLQLEDALKYCKGKLQVMIDNKIPGNDTLLFGKVVLLLKKYGLDKETLMIGTDESTGFFTGKIKLSCTRKQLEDNMQKPGYSPDHYYLFGNDLNKEDVLWAKQNGILAVGVVNAWRYRNSNNAMEEAQQHIQQLKSTGLSHFQIDSQFDRFFFEK